ncbi:MAG TPA: hypothetical protein VER96_33920 [Polyangiaceae bacterium]|nr:hypothetical protein [Polyangiaceae bacterium]
MLKTSTFALAAALTVATVTGCASTPAAPFDQLKTANLTAYRLGDATAPAATAATPAAPAAVGIPGVPPELNAWIQQGAQAAAQILPGLLPGAAAAALPAPDTTPRFHDSKIFSQTQVLDPELKETLGKVLGDKDSFDNSQARCPANTFLADFGLSFTSASSSTPNDLLISFRCNQVVSRSFAWPHPATGMTESTVKKLSEIALKIFPQGT